MSDLCIEYKRIMGLHGEASRLGLLNQVDTSMVVSVMERMHAPVSAPAVTVRIVNADSQVTTDAPAIERTQAQDGVVRH